MVEYPLLEVIIRYVNGSKESQYLAMNEATVKSAEGTLVTEVEIRGEYFETFRGDGLCISTPSGSTAYNKALGGAIIHPSIEAIQIAEMASINNRVFRTVGSPLVLPKHHTCVLKPAAGMNLQITVDHLTMVHQDVKSISIASQTRKYDLFVSAHSRSGNEFVTRLLQINRKGYIFEQIYIEMGYRAG